MTNQILSEEFRRMQKLAGILTESQLNEDILELKQMSKQLYSFLKKKGFAVKIVNKIVQPFNPKNPKGSTSTTQNTAVQSSKNEEHIQIAVQEGSDGEMVEVLITPSIVARLLVGGGDDWTNKAGAKFGNEWATWQKNPEIVAYVNKLGNELLAEIKTKYPNMAYKFAQQNFYYILYFGYAQTAKGGNVDPNQRPNAPKPQAESIEQVVNEALKAYRKK